MGRSEWIKTQEKNNLVCPNKACGKTFSKALKTTNLHEGKKDQYDACPYCLTEIINVEIENDNPPEITVTEAIVSNETPSKKEEKASGCQYYRGYLGEKDHNKQIPEDCMVCSFLIDCMHKK